MEKVKKIRINSDQENLIRLLEYYSASDRQDFLNYIDKILCECFGIKRSELPWLDPRQSEIKWDNIETYLGGNKHDEYIIARDNYFQTTTLFFDTEYGNLKLSSVGLGPTSIILATCDTM